MCRVFQNSICQYKIGVVAAFVLVSCSVASHATTLSFTFQDTAGDPQDDFDVTEISVRFDNQTGDFSIKAIADPAHPFTGNHLLYLNVFNPDVGSAEPSLSFFSLIRFSFSTTSSTNMLERSGTSPVLMHWKAGDRVASYDALGLPDGIASFNSVMGGTRHLFSASDAIQDLATIVPEPRSLVLAAVATIATLIRTIQGRRGTK